ncbi:MAG: DoxX family protein [Bacteriovoracia bacterium]
MALAKYLRVPHSPIVPSIALLILRVITGIAFMFHGWGKIQNPLSWMGPDANMPAILQALAALSEFGGGFLLAIGLFVPVASFGLLCTMTVAASTHIMRGDPFVGRGGSYELASVYFAVSMLFLVGGPGRFSADRVIFGNQ